MTKEMYQQFDDLFLNISKVLNNFCKSSVLQTYFSNVFTSYFYGNLINKFFANLNQQNVIDYNLPKGNLGQIKNKYKKIKKDVNMSLSGSLKGRNIDKKYYDRFKLTIKKDFPGFERIISEIEREISITNAEKYLKKKEKEIKSVGKPDDNFHLFVQTKALELYVEKKKTLSVGRNFYKITESITRKVLPEFSKKVLKSLKKTSKEMLDHQRDYQEGFNGRLYNRWKKPIDLLECLIKISMESGEGHAKKLNETTDKTNHYKREALIKIHARALQIANEILVLIKSGFADGANARWRSLHELAVISYFLFDNNNEVSQRYLEHETIKSYKAANDYKTYYKKLGYAPLDRKQLSILKKKKEKLCTKYPDKFQSDYGWIPETIIKNRNFRELEKYIKLDALRPYYNLSSDSVHGGSKGFYRLGLMDDSQNKILLVGASDYGLADPIQNTAISLLHVTVCLLSLEPDFESLLNMQIMSNYTEEIGSKAVEAQKKIEEKYWKSKQVLLS